MSHCVTTVDEVQVCGFTGEAPRAGEVLTVYGGDSVSFRGEWTVLGVRWVMHPETLCNSEAHVYVEPNCEAAVAWLESARRERAKVPDDAT